MSSWPSFAAVVLLAGAALAQAQGAAVAPSYPGIGRAATAAEVAAWDIDVRPDFKGLPKGSGSVARGMAVWEAQCASCHGVFGESNEVFSPIVGGTTADDVRRGRVAALADTSFPGRTTMMKLPTVSSMWDYIRRAMPWNRPKSLTDDEVYATTAYILHLAGVLPAEFTLSDANIAEVQRRLPNRDGMTTSHAMWPGAGSAGRKPDVAAQPCMTGCAGEPRIATAIPDHARDAHGNLAEQNRGFGPQVGVDTRRGGATSVAAAVAAGTTAPAAARTAAAPAAAAAGAHASSLARKHGCLVCHGTDSKIVGPALRDVARKYAGRADAADYLASRIKGGGTNVWGAIPMPPQALPEADARAIARWLADDMR